MRSRRCAPLRETSRTRPGWRVRSNCWRAWVAVAHALLLAASYAGVLVVSDANRFAPAKWLIQISCIAGAGLFVRWLVASVTALATSERAARDVAERARTDLERVGAAKTKFL